GERTILAYPGSEINHQILLSTLEDVETRWLYISSLNSLDLLEGAFRYAKVNQVRVAFNPGGIELDNPAETKLLLQESDVDVLILNKQEASILFGEASAVDLARHGCNFVKICIVTDGPNGAHAHDGQIGYYQPISDDVEVIDRTGAGDAFASGVVSYLALGNDLESALEFGSKNSTSVVQHLGPHEGIIRLRTYPT
ncbi:MAG TPA: PfkB family carbohydrate kinase, partial [Candidatus Saccharimonadales bacterium]|nr:PfkB family carbohydrate kinase [Candidatus Saccharimonadales bacterium]